MQITDRCDWGVLVVAKKLDRMGPAVKLKIVFIKKG
jgi:hypothetical protein